MCVNRLRCQCGRRRAVAAGLFSGTRGTVAAAVDARLAAARRGAALAGPAASEAV